MLLEDNKESLKSILTDILSDHVYIDSIQVMSGGCINDSYKITTNKGLFFLKKNKHSIENLFYNEKKGLDIISSTLTIKVPQILYCDKDILLLSFIEKTNPTINNWLNFAKDLASLHRIRHDYYGLDHNNYIGSLIQYNNQTSKWIDFFINQRIKPQLNLGKMPTSILHLFDKLFVKLDNILTCEQPSLLHGDLWSGNFIFNNDDTFLVDPAIYYGSREMDISMSMLFGGFDNTFYNSYNECYPLDSGWQDRVDIYNLYPLLVHANLFGGNYFNQIKSILNYVI